MWQSWQFPSSRIICTWYFRRIQSPLWKASRPTSWSWLQLRWRWVVTAAAVKLQAQLWMPKAVLSIFHVPLVPVALSSSAAWPHISAPTPTFVPSPVPIVVAPSRNVGTSCAMPLYMPMSVPSSVPFATVPTSTTARWWITDALIPRALALAHPLPPANRARVW